MIRNYLRIAWRNLLKNKLFSFVNLAGFSLGFIAAIFIALYVADELSFDQYHANSDQVYRITETIQSEQGERQIAGASGQIAGAAVDNFPEVENVVQLNSFGRLSLGYQEFRDYEPIITTDPNFFQIFDCQFMAGDPETALKEPYSVVLTQTLAKKYFGNESPLGKTMYTNISENGVKVTGVIADFPANSHLDPPLLFSTSTVFSALPNFKGYFENDWSSQEFTTYLLLQKNANPEVLASRLTTLANEHRTTEFQQNQYHLQPLTDIHFYSQNLESDHNAHKGQIAYVYIFAAVGILILAIAFINYINLSTARAMKRMKEVGLRKTVGASQRQLIFQFMGESLLMVVLTLILAITVVQLLMPAFNTLSGKDLQLQLLGSSTLLELLAAGLVSGVLAGAYPAFFLSHMKPSLIMRQPSAVPGSHNTFRHVLVVAQFAIAIVLITATVVIYQQMSFIRNSDLGYDRSQLVTVDINSQPMWEKYETVKAAFEKIPAVESVTATSRVPGDWKGIPVAGVKKESGTVKFMYLAGDEDFLPTYHIQLLEGRNFRHTQADSAKVLLNETAAQAMGLQDPVGQTIEITQFDDDKLDHPFVAEVIGIIQDVHFQSVREKIIPTLITYYQNPLHSIDYYTLKINAQDMPKTIAALGEIALEFDPASPLEYHFLDDKFEELYTTDTKRGEIFGIAALLAIFIACLGLFGLTNLSVEQRTREVGIRKVLGADVSQITWLISSSFLKLVGIAFLIATPFAWWATQSWLNEFAYHINMTIYLLIFSGIVVLLIAIFTVSFQTIKAALANPVKALRYE